MITAHKADWGDKVRIIGISIDKAADDVVKHVEKNAWKDVEHFHRGASTSTDDYGVNGVPHVVLVDGEGKIAFIGHPATRKLKDDIDTLLKGEKLEGIKDAAEEEEDEDTESFKDLDLDAINKEIDTFNSKLPELSNNETVKTHAAKL